MHDDNCYFNILRYNIKKNRKKAGLTQQQLADKAQHFLVGSKINNFFDK